MFATSSVAEPARRGARARAREGGCDGVRAPSEPRSCPEVVAGAPSRWGGAGERERGEGAAGADDEHDEGGQGRDGEAYSGSERSVEAAGQRKREATSELEVGAASARRRD